MNKKFVSSIRDLEPTIFDSMKNKFLSLVARGPQFILVVSGLFVMFGFVKYRADVRLLIHNFHYELLISLISKISLVFFSYWLILLFFLYFVLMPIGIMIQRRSRWEYTDSGVLKITNSSEMLFNYNNMRSVVVEGKIRMYVTFKNSSSFPEIVTTSWYGTDQDKFYELIEFLIEKKSDLREKIYLRQYKGQSHYLVPSNKWKETLSEYFSTVKFI